MVIISLFFIWLGFQDDPPLKPITQFEVLTNYQLKAKPGPPANVVILDSPNDDRKETGTDLLPYLTIQLKVKTLHPMAERIKIVDGHDKNRLNKKVSDEGVYDLDLGYVDDIKDGITTGKYVVNFYEGKKILERITITVEKDGTFSVNGVKRGKF